VVVLFPEFSQVFADPCRPTALAVLEKYPSAKAIREAGIEAMATLLQVTSPRNYGQKTARRLVELAEHSISSDLALEARSLSVKIWCEQARHLQTHLTQLEEQIEQLLAGDPDAKHLQGMPEFGPKTVAVLRAELGDVARFQRLDQVVAYGGMDSERTAKRQVARSG